MDCITYQVNPIRSGTVRDLKSLDRYVYAGHSRVVGKRISPWQDVDLILRRFGRGQDVARRPYREFVAQGIGQGQRPELIGGGLLRSVGGWAVGHLGLTATEVGKALGLSKSGVCRAVERGRRLTKEQGWRLEA